MTAYWKRRYHNVIRHAALVTPDGMPLVWALRLLGVSDQQRVYGPDLMLAWCERAAHLGLPIYLYGSTEQTLAKLQANLQQRFPNLSIAGCHAPPFRTLTQAEADADLERICQSGAKVVFVGMGCPKQEYWMYRQRGQFPGVMIGVGAAFNFFSGDVRQAPRWMMKFGLEWFYRFTQEPGRLWKRYLINNPAFIILFSLQLIGHWLHHRPTKHAVPARSSFKERIG
jgi:N-acetylglucosaminyldiphosphoundecaprenol N-acetyl-beta-D-mannosaminyltransferase